MTDAGDAALLHRQRGASGRDGMALRMYLRGAGWSGDETRRRPRIGICNSWSELNPCNMGLRDLAEAVKRGVLNAGGLPLEFPTISVAEAFTRISSLYLRNLMAIDVEEMIATAPIDGVVLLNGCDKTVPAQLMGAMSAGKPAIALAAGQRDAAYWRGDIVTITDLWKLREQRGDGEIDDEGWLELEAQLSPSVGTCSIMGTAVTMAMVTEALGMALPGTAVLPATSAARRAAAEATGRRAVELAREGVKPASVVTLGAIENAVRVACGVSGSTNAVIHLLAIARRLGLPLTLERFAELSRTTPVVAEVCPSGAWHVDDLVRAGGTPSVMKALGDAVDATQLSGSGAPWSEVLAAARPPDHALFRQAAAKRRSGALAVLHGTLAPSGAVLKQSATSARLRRHRGPAVVFSGMADYWQRGDDPAAGVDEDSVVIVRGEGPVGGPGMPELHIPVPRSLRARGVEDIVRVTDGRMSGSGAGTVILHAAPEAAIGGPIGLVRDGDLVELDVEAGRLDLLVDDRELAARATGLGAVAAPTRGFAALHHDHVLQADSGCDLDFLGPHLVPTGRPKQG